MHSSIPHSGGKTCCFPEDTWKSTWVQRWFKELVQIAILPWPLWLSREEFIAEAKQKYFSPDTRKEAPAGQYLPGSKDNSLIEKAGNSSSKPALLYQGFLKQQIWKVRKGLGNLCLAHFPSAGRRRQGSIYSQVRIIVKYSLGSDQTGVGELSSIRGSAKVSRRIREGLQWGRKRHTGLCPRFQGAEWL